MRRPDLGVLLLSMLASGGLTFGMEKALAGLPLPARERRCFFRVKVAAVAVKLPVRTPESPPTPAPPPVGKPSPKRGLLASARPAAPARAPRAETPPLVLTRLAAQGGGRLLPPPSGVPLAPILLARAPAGASGYGAPAARVELRRAEPLGSGGGKAGAGRPSPARAGGLRAFSREICGHQRLKCQVSGLGDRQLREPAVEPEPQLPAGVSASWCRLRLNVDRFGDVVQARTISAPFPAVGVACEQALRGWKFESSKDRNADEGEVELHFSLY